MPWFVIGVFSVLFVVAAWPRMRTKTVKTLKGPRRSRKRYCYAQFALLATAPIILMVITMTSDISKLAAITFWVMWLVTLIVTVIGNGHGFWRAFTGFLATFAVLFILMATLGVNTPSTNATQAATVQTTDGKTLPHKGNDKHADPAKPVAGKSTMNDTDAQASLKDGKGSVKSWNDLVQRVYAMPPASERTYIDAVNARSKYIGTWSDVRQYAKAEKKYGLDTRVILVINSTVSDREARDAVRKDVGSAADKLPLLRLNDVALVNTRGVDTGNIADFADARSQVRVLLTVPVKKNGKYVANIKGAQNGKGVLTECKNPSTGLVHHPKPTPAAPGKPRSPKSTPSTPDTPTTPETPSTTPPTKSTPTPSETPPTTTPPTTNPPTTQPPETCPPGQKGTPPNCLETKGPVIVPSGDTPNEAPPGSPEPTAPKEPKPADPKDDPEATPLPDRDVPSSQPTGTPTTGDRGDNIPDPDASALWGMALGIPLLALGMFLKRPRREEDNDA